ncbi:hypothetical protein [Gymnodinialimonas ulvae]|uniref:hypothetical protein n=1 Tax=Gymnodinialimonas ulvae TaxID=3126504 RepID=UPI0030B20137
MTRSSAKPTLSRAALCIATALFAAPASANFVGVSLCNDANSSTFGTVLHIVDGGARYTIAPGQAGLTPNIIMNERAAIQWVSASGLFPQGTVFGNYSGYVCGMQRGTDTPTRDEPTRVSSPRDRLASDPSLRSSEVTERGAEPPASGTGECVSCDGLGSLFD